MPDFDHAFADTEELLTPSRYGEQCRHNGDSPNYEIACDECDYFLLCFPDWEERSDIDKPTN